MGTPVFCGGMSSVADDEVHQVAGGFWHANTVPYLIPGDVLPLSYDSRDAKVDANAVMIFASLFNFFPVLTADTGDPVAAGLSGSDETLTTSPSPRSSVFESRIALSRRIVG